MFRLLVAGESVWPPPRRASRPERCRVDTHAYGYAQGRWTDFSRCLLLCSRQPDDREPCQWEVVGDPAHIGGSSRTPSTTDQVATTAGLHEEDARRPPPPPSPNGREKQPRRAYDIINGNTLTTPGKHRIEVTSVCFYASENSWGQMSKGKSGAAAHMCTWTVCTARSKFPRLAYRRPAAEIKKGPYRGLHDGLISRSVPSEPSEPTGGDHAAACGWLLQASATPLPATHSVYTNYYINSWGIP